MITNEQIERINALAKKAKSPEGLSEAEKEEQQLLRRAYIDSFKANLRAQLDSIKIVDPSDEAEVEEAMEEAVREAVEGADADLELSEGREGTLN